MMMYRGQGRDKYYRAQAPPPCSINQQTVCFEKKYTCLESILKIKLVECRPEGSKGKEKREFQNKCNMRQKVLNYETDHPTKMLSHQVKDAPPPEAPNEEIQPSSTYWLGIGFNF